MKIPEHLTLSFLLAQLGVQEQYGSGGTCLVVLAGILPDLDGLTLVAGWRFYRTHHRIVGHGLPLTLAGPALLAWLGVAGLGMDLYWSLWGWLQLSLVIHLATDVWFYRWPVKLLWPLSARAWGGGLIAWNDLVPTLVLYAATAVTVVVPGAGLTAATLGLSAFLLYLAWRAWRPPARWGWSAWLAGGWARGTPRFWRWLTGDFVT